MSFVRSLYHQSTIESCTSIWIQTVSKHHSHINLDLRAQLYSISPSPSLLTLSHGDGDVTMLKRGKLVFEAFEAPAL